MGVSEVKDVSVITEEEKKLIPQLREKVKDDLPQSFHCKSDEDQDLYLVRWLRARDHKLANAATMLSNSLKWRRERQADDILKTLKLDPFYLENFPFYHVGADKHGHPIILAPLGSWDFRKIINDAKRLAEFDDFATHLFESYVSKIEEHHRKSKETGGPPVTQIFFIIDVKNYPYMQLMSLGAMKKLIQLASTYEAHYPEILFRCVFVNCPSYFNLLMNMLKPVLAPKTLSKITMYSQIKDWQKDMMGEMDPSLIPQQYGGTAEDMATT